MKLITDDQPQQMLTNGLANAGRSACSGETDDLQLVLKLFCPSGGVTWLLTELVPGNPDIGFALCDLGLGCPELDNVSLAEIESVCGPGGPRI